jgi:2-oxo-4-hydroxy-4-carboxy-5-ureidoimidazoline decarboxylase
MTIDAINQMDRDAFVQSVGWVFEHSPWVAHRAWDSRPFPSIDALHQSMTEQVIAATRDEQLHLLCSHPDLGARAVMTTASANEQSGAGLYQLTPDEFHRLHTANSTYREKFGFPFLYAVKGSTKYGILDAIESRVQLQWEDEFQTALLQVFRIAGFRLQDLVE